MRDSSRHSYLSATDFLLPGYGLYPGEESITGEGLDDPFVLPPFSPFDCINFESSSN